VDAELGHLLSIVTLTPLPSSLKDNPLDCKTLFSFGIDANVVEAPFNILDIISAAETYSSTLSHPFYLTPNQ
jgi:hypothetical protein